MQASIQDGTSIASFSKSRCSIDWCNFAMKKANILATVTQATGIQRQQVQIGTTIKMRRQARVIFSNESCNSIIGSDYGRQNLPDYLISAKAD